MLHEDFIERDIARAEALIERVWRGRYGLRELAVDPGLENITIVVPEETFALLAMVHRRTMMYARLPISMPVDGSGVQMRLFGTAVHASKDLAPGEVRFRSEVAL